MDLWNYLAGGAAFGAIAGLWGKIKDAFWKGIHLVVQRVEIHTEAAHDALVAHLVARYPRSRLYERMYAADYEHHRDGRYGLVPYEQFGNRGVIFWNGWWPFLFSNAVEAKARASGGQQPPANSDDDVTKVFSTLSFLRGTLDIEALLREACRAANDLAWAADDTQKKTKNRFVIHYVPARGAESRDRGHHNSGLAWYQRGDYRLLAHTPDQLGKSPLHRGSALATLIFPPRVKGLIAEIELWRSSREWYLDRGIPWKRGWLLYGPPGTGKTALARAFAEDLNLPIYVFNLAEMGNPELIKAWGEMQVNVPCLALIEDIDNVFHGRENVARRHSLLSMFAEADRKDGKKDDDRRAFTPLTFDCLLNCLDGVERVDGVFTIITTNDIAKVDPALGQPRRLPDGSVEFISTRPGRIDKAVELTYMEVGDKKRMAERILGGYPAEHRAMLDFIDRFPELAETPAQFQERCGQAALACFWREKQGPVPPPAIPELAQPAEKAREAAAAAPELNGTWNRN